MKHLTLLLVFFFSLVLHSQSSQKELNELNYKGKAFRLILSDINNFISQKSTGYLYPVTRVLITNKGNEVEVEIKGIDNSWSYLFGMEEIPYGYMIVESRLFVISYKNTNDSFMANLFEKTNQVKQFNTQTMFPPSTERNPSWLFEYKDGKYIWLRGENLNVLY